MAENIETTTNAQPTPITDTQQDKKGNTGAASEPTFTQAEIDKIVGKRAVEAKQAAITELLKELGFEKPDELKSLVSEAKKRKETEMSEADKLRDALAKITTERDNAAQRAQEVEALRIADRVNSKLEALATKARVEHPEDVVKYLREYNADDVKGLVNEDGSVNDTAAAKLLEVVKKARPNWFAVSGLGSPSNNNGRPPQPDNKTVFKNKISY